MRFIFVDRQERMLVRDQWFVAQLNTVSNCALL